MMVNRLPRVLRPKSSGIASLRMGTFYTVASVELGNTTTKAIIVTTNLKSAEIFEIEKEVRMTRDVRPPKSGEDIFGETVFGVPLTKESVTEMISSILTSVLSKSKLDIERDLHFVVPIGFMHLAATAAPIARPSSTNTS